MKKAKLKKQKQKKENNTQSETFSVKSKIITTVVLLLCLVGFYFLTTKLVKKTNIDELETVTINVREDNNINYSDIDSIKDSTYYLLLDTEDDENNSSYDSYINALKYSNYPEEFYYINLSSDENKDILGDKEKLKKLSELKVKDTTLIYVSDGKIKESYVGSEKIINQLQSFFTSSDESNSNESKDKSNSNSNKKSNDSKNKSNSNSNKKSNDSKDKSNSNSNKTSNDSKNKSNSNSNKK